MLWMGVFVRMHDGPLLSSVWDSMPTGEEGLLNLVQHDGEAMQEVFASAQWIGVDELIDADPDTLVPGQPSRVSPANSWYAFRRDWDLAEATELGGAVPCAIAADSHYWLWVNGCLVVREGGLKRGPSPHGSYADICDLGPYLQPGRNRIAVLLWHFGKHGFSHRSSGRAGLLFHAQCRGQKCVSDASWMVRRHPAFMTAAGEEPNYRLPESNILFDAQLALHAWETTEADADWQQALCLGPAGSAPWGHLVERPIPFFVDKGLVHCTQALPALPWTADGSQVCIDLPANLHVTLAFDVTAAAGQEIGIQTDHYMGGGHPNLREAYRCVDGRQQYEGWSWMNGHQIQVQFPAGVVVHDLWYRETIYDSQVCGAFSSDDQVLDTLWEKSCRTLLVCMRDTFMDCPDRERAQWWGDVVIQLQQCFYALDDNSHDLIRKGLAELFNWQRADGSCYSPVPSGNYNRELPMQMLSSVGTGIWHYYQHTGDRDFVRQWYPSIARYLDLWTCGEDGLVVQRPGEWTWGDWGRNKDMPLLYNGWYAWAMRCRADCARLCGLEQDAERCEAIVEQLALAFDTVFWNEEAQAYRSPDHDGPVDDRGQALAIFSGLASAERAQAVLPSLLAEQHASCYMELIVLEVLCQLGQPEQALQRMRERFGPMADHPGTTLWEGWELDSKVYGGGTQNHAWSGGPMLVLSRHIAGITPAKPGYQRVRVAPQPAGLRRCDCRLKSIRGPIQVAWDLDKQSFRCVAPTPVELHLPQAWHIDEQSLAVHGARQEENYIVLPAGSHVVTLTSD